MKQDQQDLRTLFKKERESEDFKLKAGHKERFFDLLDKELPKKQKSHQFLFKVAAAVILICGTSFLIYQKLQSKEVTKTTIVNVEPENDIKKGISLGDLSPDLKKVENYYVANINLELSRLKLSEDNKALVDSFMERLVGLNTEYQTLNKELNRVGPNDQTIAALINNLQLRLQLLQKLKEKLNELKSSKNETELHI